MVLYTDIRGRCESNSTYMNIYSKERCEEAAAYLGLADTSVPVGVDYDDVEGVPPYGCYYRNNLGASGSLYFNNDTKDLGNDDCGSFCDSICALREGCTDPSFMEFDQFAVYDDGSCRVPTSVLHADDGVCRQHSLYYETVGILPNETVEVSIVISAPRAVSAIQQLIYYFFINKHTSSIECQLLVVE